MPGLRHSLYLYDDDVDLAGRMGPFLTEGLESGDAVLVLLEPSKEAIVREALGPDAGDVVFLDSERLYARPESAIAGYDATLRRLAGTGIASVRAFAELPIRETPEERRAWSSYEAIMNVALAHHPMWVVCGYDARTNSDELIEDGVRTHRDVFDDEDANPGYDEPEDVVRDLGGAPAPLPVLRMLPADGDARALRDLLRSEPALAGLPAETAGGFLVAVGEVLTNARRHGGGVESVRLGRDGERVVCEITDRGPGLDAPLAGHVPPGSPHAGGAAGLWVARQMTRRLETLPAPQGGLTVRLWA